MELKHHSRSEEKLLKNSTKKGDLETAKQFIIAKTSLGLKGKKCDFLKFLLLTGNEIDLKKVLCLHLHAITEAPKPCRRYGDKNKIKEFTEYSFVLPNCFVHDFEESEFYCKCWYNENKEKIGKFRPCKIHMAVNAVIVEILETVIEVLNKFDKFALEKLVSLSHDLAAIKSCLLEKQYLDFIAILHSSGILSNAKFLRTEVCTIIKATQKMFEVAHIRKNMVLSLRMPDFGISNNLFRINENNKSVLDLPAKIKNILTSNSATIENSSTKDLLINNDSMITISKSRDDSHIELGNGEGFKQPKKLPHFYNPAIKRWPHIQKEININKELEKIKRINNKYFKKYNFNFNDNKEIKYKNQFSRISLENKLENDKKLSNAEQKASKSNTVKINTNTMNNFSDQPIVSLKRNIPYKQQNELLQTTNKRANNTRISQKNVQSNSLPFLQIKDLKKDITGEIPIISFDKSELRNALLKVVLQSKLKKLISSVDNSLIND